MPEHGRKTQVLAVQRCILLHRFLSKAAWKLHKKLCVDADSVAATAQAMDARVTVADPIPSPDFIAMKISELKQYLASRGVDCSHCVEKAEIVALAQSLPAEPTLSARAASDSMPPLAAHSNSVKDQMLACMILELALAGLPTPPERKVIVAQTLLASKKLLREGARLDVIVDVPASMIGIYAREDCFKGLAAVRCCAMQYLPMVPGSEALLDVLLTEHKGRPININASFPLSMDAPSRARCIADVLVTPLQMAIKQGTSTSLKRLLAAGANPHIPCYQHDDTRAMQKTLHSVVLGMGLINTSRPGMDTDVDSLLTKAQILLDAGVDIEQRNGHGSTPLLLSMEIFTLRNVRANPCLRWSALALKLIAAGANVHARQAIRKDRPFDVAAHRGLLDVMRALMAKGADATPVPYLAPLSFQGAVLTDEETGTGTHYIERAIENNQVDVLKFAAEEAGVDLNALRTVKGESVYAYAREMERWHYPELELGSVPSAADYLGDLRAKAGNR